MLYPIRFLIVVGNDIDRIWEFHKENPDYADRVVREIFEATDQLSNFPYSGPVLADSRLKGYRQLIAVDGDYRIIYKARKEDVLIFAVFATRQHLHGAWYSEKRKESEISA
jgi:addiction module RelE/StbE family toxin